MRKLKLVLGEIGVIMCMMIPVAIGAALVVLLMVMVCAGVTAPFRGW